MINQDKLTGGMTNSSKVSIGETWGSITTSWQNEVRRWLRVSQLLTNNYRIDFGFLLMEDSGALLLENGFNLIFDYGSNITNVAKP